MRSNGAVQMLTARLTGLAGGRRAVSGPKRFGRFGWLVPPAIVALVLALYTFVIAQGGLYLEVLPETLALMLFSLGWNIVGGYAGEPAFGHGAFFGIGGFVTVLLSIDDHIVPIAGMWPAAVVAMGAALIIGVISLRFRDVYFALATTAFPLILSLIVTYLGYSEVSFPFQTNVSFAYLGYGSARTESVLAGIFVVAAVALSSLLEGSTLGLSFRAVRANEHAAGMSGVAVRRVKVGALVLSAGISALAGALYAASALVLTPDSFFGLLVSMEPIIFAMVGGMGTVWGPVIGAAILVPAQQVLTTDYGSSIPGIAPLLYGGVVIIFVLLFPEGIYLGLRRLAALAARLTGRNGVAVEPDAPSTRSDGVGVSVRESHQDRRAEVGGVQADADLLVVRDVQKSFGGLRVLDGVTFRVGKGEIVGVIGPNGAGKTTLFDIMSGFVRADAGSVKLDGRELLGLRSHQVCRAGVGRTFQVPRIFVGLTVAESVTIAAKFRVSSREVPDAVAEALATMQLTDKKQRQVQFLSTGEVRRLELARALVGLPAVVFLDEFLGGIGGEETDLIMSGLAKARENGCTIVAVEHTMHAMVSFVDRFVVLESGRVCAEGTAAEIGRNPVVIEAYLGRRWASRAVD
jgi:ABC-type branched-subunit amino acid transport system ATPase component/ABC-type branched-subunit amino acid transport system permease subunit